MLKSGKLIEGPLNVLLLSLLEVYEPIFSEKKFLIKEIKLVEIREHNK